jgi:transcriptional regulator with XRE-family HTH domain
MKNLGDERTFFQLALLADLEAQKRGSQKKLADETGISPSLICDIKRGRAGGSLKKRQIIAKALGYKSYEEIIDRGRKLDKEASGNRIADTPPAGGADEKPGLLIKRLERRLSVQAQKLIALQEKHIAVQERYIAAQAKNTQLSLENARLQQLVGEQEGLCGPSAGAGLIAPAIGAK